MSTPFNSLVALVCCAVAGQASGQLSAPPTILKGIAPTGDVHGMPNNQNTLAHLADGSIVAVVYRQTSDTTGGHLTLAISRNTGVNWTNYPLPQNTGHRAHEWNSGVLCAGRDCDVVHVGWADRSNGGTYHSAYYQAFNTRANKWQGGVVTLGAADPGKRQEVFTEDIAVTPLDTVVLAIGVGATGGLGMGAHEGGLVVKKRGASGFSKLFPMRNGGMGWAREASICVIDEVVHCAFKNQKGAGGMAYRSFDTATMQWQQPTQVMVGPNDNGKQGVDGINAGNRGIITEDTHGGLNILYVTGSNGGLKNNNKMRIAYAKPGTGGKNSDWADLEILAHNATVGSNPRGVKNPDPAYPQLQGGDTDYFNYAICPGPRGGIFLVYSKPWETFQNKYMQVWIDGVNQPFPTREISFWPDLEPYMFERLCGLRNTSSVGHAAWIAYGKNDKPRPGQSPNGHIRLWATTYSLGRTNAFGTGCKGSLKQFPRMGSDDHIPTIGSPYNIEFDRFPIFAKFFMAIGTFCQKTDLTFLGAPGCELNIDFSVTVPLQVDINGYFKATFNIPNDTALIGRAFYTQSFIFNSLANPGGAITSNALRTTLYL